MNGHSLPPRWWQRVRHDLRGAIGPVRLAVQLLRGQRVDAAEREEALAVIERQVDQLLAEIDDVGELLRVQSGAYAHAPVRQDANLLLDLVCGRGGLIRGLGNRQLRLLCEPCAREALVEHDPARVSALLEYLLLRIAVHAEAGGELKLALLQGDDGVELRLSGARASFADDEDIRYLVDGEAGGGEPATRALLMREALRAGQMQLAHAGEGAISLRFAASAG